MTLTHEAMLKDAVAKAALEIPLVVIGSVDKYKPRNDCEMRIETWDGRPNKISIRISDQEFQFLRQICDKFNDNERKSATLSIFPC